MSDDAISSDASAKESFAPRVCAACRVIDKADGLEDGTMFRSAVGGVRNEHWIWHKLRRAEGRTADRVTTFSGSMRFVYLHGVWFGVWIVINVGLAGVGWEFDKFPFGLLTMIVSLEAIFLATFVMISQNRQAERADLRAEIDFETNLRAEIWAVHIGERLGIDADHVEGVVIEALAAARKHLAPDDVPPFPAS
jgi:uncharacterized membrane protein